MTVKEWAGLLNRRDINDLMTREEEKAAKADGVVIVFGESDDLVEFMGAIRDEAGAYDGAVVFIDGNNLLAECPDDNCECQYCGYEAAKAKAKKIEAVWCPKNEEGVEYASWLIKTDITHEPFDILDDGELYCRAIVFSAKADECVFPAHEENGQTA